MEYLRVENTCDIFPTGSFFHLVEMSLLFLESNSECETQVSQTTIRATLRYCKRYEEGKLLLKEL